MPARHLSTLGLIDTVYGIQFRFHFLPRYGGFTIRQSFPDGGEILRILGRFQIRKVLDQ